LGIYWANIAPINCATRVFVKTNTNYQFITLIKNALYIYNCKIALVYIELLNFRDNKIKE